MEYRVSDKMVNMKPSAIREIFKSLGTPGAISFAAGNPAPESFPVEDMARIGADIFANSAVQALQYSVTEGYPRLREQVRARLLDKFGIGTENDDLIIVTGGQQGIELSCKVLCNEGDTVIAENPSFIGALNAFRSLGAKIRGVELTDKGMDTAALERPENMPQRAAHLTQRDLRVPDVGYPERTEIQQVIAEDIVAREYDEIGIERVVSAVEHVYHRPARVHHILRVADLQEAEAAVRTEFHRVAVHRYDLTQYSSILL